MVNTAATIIAAAALLSFTTGEALAQEASGPALDLSATLTVDLVSLPRGAGDADPHLLTNLDLEADADFARLLGLDGTRGYVHVLDNRGSRPNDLAGTLQGIDNIEVAEAGTRLFEAWVDHTSDGGTSVLAGLYDLNSEFYVSEAGALLIAPPFGIGSEFAATGPNGPSIFPSSALAVRLKVPVARGRGRLQAAVINAAARTLGDHGGIDLSFRSGLLLAAEAGVEEGPVRAGLGGWAYTKPQGSVFAPPQGGLPVKRHAQGAYGMVEVDLGEALQWFARAGLAAGQVSPFSGGMQSGFLLSPALTSRPDSGLSAGYNRAWISRAYRQQMRSDALVPASVEEAFAVAYADKLGPVGLQGDVQWIRRPGALQIARDLIVTTLRLTFAL